MAAARRIFLCHFKTTGLAKDTPRADDAAAFCTIGNENLQRQLKLKASGAISYISVSIATMMLFRHLLVVLFTTLLLLFCVIQPTIAQDEDGGTSRKKPNILMIAVDDLNSWVGYFEKYTKKGHKDSLTPNFDRLSAMGVSFTNAHASSTICNPSRAKPICLGQCLTTTTSHFLKMKQHSHCQNIHRQTTGKNGGKLSRRTLKTSPDMPSRK